MNDLVFNALVIKNLNEIKDEEQEKKKRKRRLNEIFEIKKHKDKK